MKDNKALQFCIALFLLFLGWKLWETGWFQYAFGPQDQEAAESVDLGAIFISASVSALQIVGVVALGLIAGFQPLAESLVESVTKWRKPAPAGVDEGKLTETLQTIVERIELLEKPDNDES